MMNALSVAGNANLRIMCSYQILLLILFSYEKWEKNFTIWPGCLLAVILYYCNFYCSMYIVHTLKLGMHYFILGYSFLKQVKLKTFKDGYNVYT